MPLRSLLGDGDESVLSQSFSTLKPSQVIMGGTRELDPPEADFIGKNGISVITVDDIEQSPAMVAPLIATKGCHNLYVHIDLDVMDPGKCPWALCLTPDGLDTGTLMALLQDLKAKVNIVGVSIVELRPVDDMDLNPLKELVTFCMNL
jgi:arginase